MSKNYKNKVYLKRNKRYYFKEIQNIINKYFKKEKLKHVLDIGCGNGDLIFHLKNFYPKVNFIGLDISKDSIDFAKKRAKDFKNIRFINKDFLKFQTTKKFDLIIGAGFLCYFENFSHPLSKIMGLTNKKKSGKILLFGDFNSSGVDKIIRHRNMSISSKWESGFNSFSIKTISNYVNSKKMKLVYKKFNLPNKITKRNDPIRSYTITTKNNKKFILNSANIVFEFYSLIITKK